jgi:mono/diheme cytochrome c family protein
VKIVPVELPVQAYYPDIRPFVAEDLLAAAKAAVKTAGDKQANLQAELDEANREIAQGPRASASAAPLDYDKQIKPIFEQRCASCHLGRGTSGGLSLASEATLKVGGKNGPAVIAGKSASSLLLKLLKGQKEPRMPLSGPPLEEAQVALIADWIDRLPRKKPEEIVKEHPGLISAAQKDIVAAKAEVVAMEARIRVEQAKYAKVPDPNFEKLTDEAKLRERDANLLRAEENFFPCAMKMTEAMAAPAQDEEQRNGARAEHCRGQEKSGSGPARVEQAGRCVQPAGQASIRK